MNLIKDLLENLPDGEVIDVRVGLHWTAVVLEQGGVRRCGLASTLFGGHGHRTEPDVPQAGRLEAFSGRELAALALLEQPTQASIGMAALNALLPQAPGEWVEANAEEILAARGKGRRVALVGGFPFARRLKSQVGELLVLDLDPGPDELPAEQAPQVLPQADVIAITGMTLANHTLENLLSLCPPGAFVMVLGPSTPLSPLLFDYGVHLVSGAVVTEIEPVLHTVSQGGNFRQVHRAGVRLVNIRCP